ncbi:MAG: hypothetical protein GW783_10805 [Deltaproteobacteria bacterium]|nr:hypothetical protein [Deltaproteobacteria bacterium]NCP95244.1 hypothetical protein [Deltaproteobacteria bacterium]NCS74599.1 hypothetical protein [Deltaproteobacteria bacterium]
MTDASHVARETSGDTPVEEARTASGQRIFTGQLFRVRDRHSWGFTEEAPPPPPDPVRRPARVAVMLALAHKIQDAIDRGTVRDRAELARRLGLTRARVTHNHGPHAARAIHPGADPFHRVGGRGRAAPRTHGPNHAPQSRLG